MGHKQDCGGDIKGLMYPDCRDTRNTSPTSRELGRIFERG